MHSKRVNKNKLKKEATTQKTLQIVRKEEALLRARGALSEERGRESRTTKHNDMERINEDA